MAWRPSGSIASKFLTFRGRRERHERHQPDLRRHRPDGGVNCITVPGQGLNIGSPLKGPLGSQDLSWTSPTSPGVGGGLNPAVADIADYTTSIRPTWSTSNTTAAWTPMSPARITLSLPSTGFRSTRLRIIGPTRAYNLWHHSAINDAFSGIWNHTFSPNFLNEARANAAGWRWNEITSNPQEPFGLPNDSVGQIGSINCRTSARRDRASSTSGPTTIATSPPRLLGNHSIKFGGELTRLYYLNEAPVQCAAQFRLLQHLGLPERCAAIRVRHL